jgi:hypothetical protein
MERIFLGIFYVVPSCVLWVFGRDTSGTLCGASKINKFLMRLQYMKSANNRYISRSKLLLRKEREIKELIKKEYHLE